LHLSFGKLSNIKIFDLSIFDLLDGLSSNILLPLGGLFIVLFVGWVMKKYELEDELTNHGKLKIGYLCLYRFLLRYIVPIAIAIVFLHSIKIIRF